MISNVTEDIVVAKECFDMNLKTAVQYLSIRKGIKYLLFERLTTWEKENYTRIEPISLLSIGNETMQLTLVRMGTLDSFYTHNYLKNWYLKELI